MIKKHKSCSHDLMKFDGELIIARNCAFGSIRNFYFNDKKHTEDEIVEALAKQLVKMKPIYKQNIMPPKCSVFKLQSQSSKGNMIPHCPACDLILTNEFYPHCKRCGQALDWNE